MDIRMPDMTGSELFGLMRSQGFPWPVIFMTGHGDLSMAVDLMKAGAFDYVTKPFDPMGLLEKVQAATQLSSSKVADQVFKREHLARLQSLTHHESLVYARILSNQTNREIAEVLENSVRTIETHRANILKKMGKSSALELAQMQERFTILGGVTPFPMTQLS
jgi:two-component system response regulator DctR